VTTRASSPVVPRPVFCAIAHAHRNRALAEAVSAGRFTHAGVTVDLGMEPEWLGAALPPDKEWRIEWTKFYYGLDLAHAFATTGDGCYQRTWERLVRSFIRQVPPGSDTSDVAARRVQNWVYAWQAFASARSFVGFSDGLEEQLLASIRDHLDHIRAHLSPERNHRTLELYALFVVALALPELDEDGSLVRDAMDDLRDNLLTDMRADGVQREHSTHYHLIALRSFLGARENARRFGLAFGPEYDARLQLAADFALHCHRPDGTIPALSDSDSGSYAELLKLAAVLLKRSDLRYAATGGAEGTPPQERQVSFPDGGYHVQRSGWGDRGRALRDERFLIFDCGALGDGGHGHYDLLSVDVAAGGRALVVDPGRYTYVRDVSNLRHWFKGTAAHNTVVVDGLDQVPYRHGKPGKGTCPTARLLERMTAPGLDVLHGEAGSTCYEARHARRITFVADEYWIVEDRLRGRRPHRYDLRFHLAPEAWERVRVERRPGGFAVRAPGVALVFAGDREPSVEHGWVAPEYGVKRDAPVISVVADGVADATFVTLMVPLADDAPAPAFEVRDGEAPVVAVVGAVGADGACRDVLTWTAAPQPLQAGLLRSHARTSWERRRNDRPVVARLLGVDVCHGWLGEDLRDGTWAKTEANR
jgi:hypothetical protein